MGDIDNAVINLKFANNTVGNIDVSRNAVFGDEVPTEILGSLQQTSRLMLTRQGIAHDTIPLWHVLHMPTRRKCRKEVVDAAAKPASDAFP